MMDLITIQSTSGTTRMTFCPSLGGLGTSLIVTTKDGERELLYFPQTHTFENHTKMCGGWPFMFPICGRLSRAEGDSRYLYNGKVYEMKIHGFAHLIPWEVIEHTGNQLTMRLKQNDFTLAQYPFNFEIILTYEISDKQLTCKQVYTNTGEDPLPYYAGFHPYFLLPFAKDRVFLKYQPKRRLAYNDKLNDIVGELPTFNTPVAISYPDLNESLVELTHDKSIELNFPDQTSLNLKVEGQQDPNMFPFVQLYHIPSEPFLCIEPWMGHPNTMNSVKGARWLPPKGSEEGILTLVFHA